MNVLKPTLHLAGCFHFHRDVWFQYRLPSHQLMLIESGRIKAETEDGVLNAGAGDLVCLRPTDLIRYDAQAPTLLYQALVQFAGPPRHRMTPCLDGMGRLPLRVSLGESFEEMRKLFEVLCLEVSHTGVVHQLRIRAALFDILAVVASVVGPHEEKTAPLDPWLRVQQRLDSSLSGNVRIEDLASQMGLSTDHFIRRFKSRFGLSPKAYHMRARLQEGARSLRDGGQSIKTVAYHLGFSDPTSFARRFKHSLGVTPSQFRSSSPSDAANPVHPQQKGFQINVHLVPPPLNWNSFVNRYLPRSSRSSTALADLDVVLDKIRHPEHYV